MLRIVVMVQLCTIAYIDYKTMKIPNKMNLLLGICGLIACIQNPDIEMMERILGFFAVSVPMYLICLVIPNAFGGGDIKLAAVMGFYLGWKKLLAGTYISFLIGGLQAAYLLVIKRVHHEKQTHMAFGPALCAGMILAMVLG